MSDPLKNDLNQVLIGQLRRQGLDVIKRDVACVARNCSEQAFWPGGEYYENYRVCPSCGTRFYAHPDEVGARPGLSNMRDGFNRPLPPKGIR